MRLKIVFFFIMLFLKGGLFGNSIEGEMKKLSFLNRYCLKIFFDKAIQKNLAAHILFFNNKPACNICLPIKYPDKTFKDTLALRGWYVFKENEYLFPHPNFIFVDHYYGDSENYRFLGIDLINKAPCKACLIENKHLFQEILGNDFDPDKFMLELEQGRSLSSLVKGDHMLLGILFGYGEESARTFKEMMSMYSGNTPPPQTETYNCIELKVPKGCKMQPVVFMGNPSSEEVKKITSTYEQEIEKAWDIYKNSENALQTTLESLCNSS